MGVRRRHGDDGSARRLILRTGPPDDVHAGHGTGGRASSSARRPRAHPSPTSSPPTIRLPHWAIRILICDAIAGETIVRRIQRALDDAAAANGCCSSARRRWPPSTAPTRTGWA